MTNLKIQNINKIYSGAVHAVKDFSMDIQEGEFIVFVGPSGCGKSTMMRMIAGLEEITSGDLVLEGRKINNVAPADRNIAMVFQNYALFGNMTVYENMGLPMAIRHMKKDLIHDKIMEAAETVELIPELNRKPGQLSGGQRQRVAIGRSLVRYPHVFLMDEPLSNLDAKLRTQTRMELAALQMKLGTTFIYVTHDQVEAMTLADRIVVMNEGEVQQIGTPNEVYGKPVNTFVGGFIGSPAMNFSEGIVEQGVFKSADLTVSLSEKMKERLSGYNGKKLILGVRPEHFLLDAQGNDRIECNVSISECLGSEYIIHFNINDNVYRAKLPVGQHAIHINDSLSLRIDSDKVTFFDSTTKMRIGDS